MIDKLLLLEWLNDFMTPPLSNGELPDFIKNKPPVDKQPIDNTPVVNEGDIFEYNTVNNVYNSPKTFYITNVTNILPGGGGGLPGMPPRLFPDTIAAATPTDPPNKPILSLQQSFAKKKFGKLLSSPLSDTTEKITIIDSEKYFDKYKAEITLAGKDYQKWLETSFKNPNFDPKKPTKNDNSWTQGCALVLNFDNQIAIQPGIKPISYFRSFYAESNKTVLQFPISGIIPKKIDFEILKPEPKEIEIKDQNLEIIGTNTLNNKMGSFLFPFTVPTYLLNIQSDDPTLKNKELTQINNSLELWKWAILNFDALIGEFPIKMEIEDKNPLNTDKTEPAKIKIPNIAESLAELYGLSVLSSQNSNIALTLIMNLIPEILGTKNVSIVNQDILKAITSYLGFKVGVRKIEYKSNFNLDEPKSWNELITPNKDVHIQGMENLSEETIAEYMARLMYVASLQKEALLTKNKDLSKNELLKEILAKQAAKDINLDTNPDDPDLTDKDKEWLEFMLHINKKDSSFNKKGDFDIPFKPEVDKHNKI